MGHFIIGMLSVCCLSFLVNTTTAAPIPTIKTKYDPPTMIGQIQPGEKIYADITALVSNILGANYSDLIDQNIKSVLGEEMFAGLDMKRPGAMYAYLRPKLEESTITFVFSIEDEKKMKKLMEKLQISLDETKVKGRYKVTGAGLGGEDTLPVYAHFAGKEMYLQLNGKEYLLDDDYRIPQSKLIFEPQLDTHLAVRFFPDLVHPRLREQLDGGIQELITELDQLEQRAPADMPKSFPSLARRMLEWARSNLKTSYVEGKHITKKLHLNPTNAELNLQAVLTPKENTNFAKELAKVGVAEGRFGQLFNEQSVVGGNLILPKGIPADILELATNFLVDWWGIVQADTELPKFLLPLVEQIVSKAAKSFKKGEVDFGIAFQVADDAENGTLIAAVALPEAKDIEKTAKEIVKKLPEEIQAMFKMDAYKIGEHSVHIMMLGQLLGEDVQKFLGKDAELHLLITADAVCLSLGVQAKKELQRMSELKPRQAQMLAAKIFPAKVTKFQEIFRQGAQETTILKNIKGSLNLFTLDIRGGKDFQIQLQSSLFSIGISAFGALAR